MEEVSVAKRIYRKRLVYWGITILFFILIPYTIYYAYDYYVFRDGYRSGGIANILIMFAGFQFFSGKTYRLERGIRPISRYLSNRGETLYDLDDAEYIDWELGLLVYDGFLLSFKEEVNCVNLEECSTIYTDFETESDDTIYFIQIELYSGETNKIQFLKTKDFKSRLDDLYAYIDEYYDISQTKNT